MADEQISEEALLQALQQLKVSDLLVQTLSTVSSLAYHRLSEEHRDLEQARLAIDALRALVPVLAGSVPADLAPRLRAGDDEPPAGLRHGRRTRPLNRARPPLVIHNPPRRVTSAFTL